MVDLRVVLVDDHRVVRDGLRMVLEAEGDIRVVGEAGDGRLGVELAQQLRPDIVLLDVLMPGMDGIETCREIKSRSPETKVLMLTSATEEDAVEGAILAGAAGYLLKNLGRQELLWAIRRAAEGASLLDPQVTARMMQRLKGLAEREREREAERLSEREKEVLALVAEGRTNREIGERLFISENTARNHVIRILDKLGLSRRSEAAAYAARHGLERPEGSAKGPGG